MIQLLIQRIDVLTVRSFLQVVCIMLAFVTAAVENTVLKVPVLHVEPSRLSGCVRQNRRARWTMSGFHHSVTNEFRIRNTKS